MQESPWIYQLLTLTLSDEQSNVKKEYEIAVSGREQFSKFDPHSF